jgi:NO-binding membrane sensor protein with MHYT domain
VTDVVQIVAVAVSASLLVLVVELVRRRRLTEEYSFIWIVCAAALLGLSVWRHVLELAATALGVHYPPAVLLLVLTLFVVVVSLYFSVVVSRHQKQIEALVEEVALLDAELRAVQMSVRSVTAGEIVPGSASHGGQAAEERRLHRY